MKFNKIAIIGVGLIGGSIGLALKSKSLARVVVGIGWRQSSLLMALKCKAVDKVTLDFKKGLAGAELVIIAVPVGKIVEMVKRAKPFLKEKAIVMDVGSTKAVVVGAIEKNLAKKLYFVGTHPLAGSEKTGVAAAHADLFMNSLCIITRTRHTDSIALQKVKSLWRGIGAEVEVMSASRHDRIVSETSHLPHILACELINQASGNLRFLAGGFRDMTRIASGSPYLWRDILLSNQKNLSRDIDKFIRGLTKLKKIIARGNSGKLLGQLKRAKEIRDSLR